MLCNYFLVEEPTLGLLRSPVQSGYWQAYSRSCIIAHETDIRGHGVAIRLEISQLLVLLHFIVLCMRGHSAQCTVSCSVGMNE